jgi:DNA-binding MarR family transcriptional regulator
MDAQAATATSLARSLTRATRALALRIEPILTPAGLTFDQWLTVDALAEATGVTMTELAAATALTGPTLTRVVDRLVMTALVYREVDSVDRRRVRVYLSSRGRATHRRLGADILDQEAELISELGAPVVGLRGG